MIFDSNLDESVDSIRNVSESAFVSYLRWPSGGAGQAVLNFVKSLPDYNHVILFYEYNTEWGLNLQPMWLVSELQKRGKVIFLKPIIESEISRKVEYKEYIDLYNGLNYFKKFILKSARLIIHHWVRHDCALIPSYFKCPRICVSHSRFPLGLGYDAYVFPSHYGYTLHDEIDRSLKSIIYNAVDTDIWKPAVKKYCSLKKIGRVSALHPSKIPENYISLIQSIIEEMPDIIHSVVGSGTYLSNLIDQIKRLQLDESIQVHGELVGQNLLSEVRSFDVCLYFTGSHIEIHPIALLEILSCGIPIIAEAKGGIPEVIKHGISGWLCNNWDDAVSYLREFYYNPELLKLFSIAAQSSVESFSLSRHNTSWDKLILKLISTV